MIIPVRCFTCGKVIGNKWDKFFERIQTETPMQEIFAELGLDRYCCRRMMISHVNLIKFLSSYDLPSQALSENR